MGVTSFLIIIISVTLSAMGQIFLKLGVTSLSKSNAFDQLASPLTKLALTLATPAVMIGFGFYAVGALIWLSALARVELSQAYPFVGIGFMLTTLAGWWFFNDHLSMQRAASIGVILLGIALLART